MNEMRVTEVGNMSSLEVKVDTLIRYCVADSVAARRFYQLNLCDLLHTAQTEQKNMASCIDRVLEDLGVPEHLLGHGYLRSAIDIAVKEPQAVHYVTGQLYPMVAKAHGTSAPLAERAIRNAIQVGWERCSPEIRRHYFGSTIRPDGARPTNAEFVARTANVVRRMCD